MWLAPLLIAAVALAQRDIALPTCTSSQYLDSTNFQCYECSNPPNAPTDPTLQEGLSARIPDTTSMIFPVPGGPAVPTKCKCKPGWITDVSQFTTTDTCNTAAAVKDFWCEAFTCTSCPEASSLDNFVCQTCGNSTDPTIQFNADSGLCECTDPSMVIQEKDAAGDYLEAKTCVPCPVNTVRRTLFYEAIRADNPSNPNIAPLPNEQDDYVCHSCSHPAMIVIDNRCVCSDASDNNPLWTAVAFEGYDEGTTCVLTEELTLVNENDYSTVEYRHVNGHVQENRRLDVDNPHTSAITFHQVVNKEAHEPRPTQLHPMVESVAPSNTPRLRRRQLASGDYTTVTVAKSAVFEHYFQAAGVSCRYMRQEDDLRSCQALASLCVLQHYDETTPACALYDDIQRYRNEWSDSDWDWQETVPWLLYKDAARSVVKDSTIQMVMSFNMQEKEGTYDYLQFVMARFSLNGTFLGWTNVTTEFEYCQPTYNKAPTWTRFGFGYDHTYDCNLLNMMEHFPEPEFYDLYLVDYGNEGRLYPVPVRNVNLRKRGEFPNDNDLPTKEDDDVLTRRFFLYDHITSRTSIQGTPEVVRYAKSIHLTIQIQESNPGKIYPPVLEVFYEERLVSDFYAYGVGDDGQPRDSATTFPVTFTVEYTEDYDGFWTSATTVFGFSMTIYALGVLLRLYNWSRRNTRVSGSDGSVDFSFVIRALFYVMSTFSQVMFWFLFMYAEYFFVFFKLQSNIHLLLPTNRPNYGITNDYYPFEFVLIMSFFGQLCRMVEVVYQQTTCDVFFIDWEKPRGRVASKRGDGTKSRFAPISVWRTLFMANEWNEIQGARKYTIEFSMLALATLLIGYDLQYLATPQPQIKDLTPGVQNPLLRFANTTFWFLLVTYGQILWKWLIQDRYFTEPPPQSFVDLCTMAKISVLILDEDYHGYYLHCRSQHEFADGNMLEISRQLRQESEGLTTDRGLPGGPPGVQTYEVYVSGAWKRQYNHIFRSMMSQEITNQQADTSSFLWRVFGRGRTKAPAEKLVRASRKLNAFLRGFIDQTTNEFPTQHREHTFIHRFLHVPPEMMSSKDTLFFADKGMSFAKVLFYGEEWNLILFNILSVTTLDLWLDNTMISIMLAYLLDLFFLGLRIAFGKSNVAAKTLVDDRFLK